MTVLSMIVMLFRCVKPSTRVNPVSDHQQRVGGVKEEQNGPVHIGSNNARPGRGGYIYHCRSREHRHGDCIVLLTAELTLIIRFYVFV
jgi:hypothetical protein